MSDSPTGHDRAPDRYTTQDRETIDRMREALRALLADPTAELERALKDALGHGMATQRFCGIEIGDHLPTRITGVLRETYDTPDNLTLPEPSAHLVTLRVDGADRYRLPGTIVDRLDDIPDALRAHQGNALGKTTADLRRLTDAELAERRAQARAKKAKRKSAQASKRRNR